MTDKRYTVLGFRPLQPIGKVRVGRYSPQKHSPFAVSFGSRKTIEDARELAREEIRDGSIVTRIVERMRAYPFTHLREIPLEEEK